MSYTDFDGLVDFVFEEYPSLAKMELDLTYVYDRLDLFDIRLGLHGGRDGKAKLRALVAKELRGIGLLSHLQHVRRS
jgi:hypothetical protein